MPDYFDKLVDQLRKDNLLNSRIRVRDFFVLMQRTKFLFQY